MGGGGWVGCLSLVDGGWHGTCTHGGDGGALEHMVGMVTGCGTRTDGGDGGGLAQMVWWGWWVTHTDGGDSEGLA